MRSSNGNSSAAEMAPLIPRKSSRRNLVMGNGSAQQALGHEPELKRNHTTLYHPVLEFIKAMWTNKLQINVWACIRHTQFLDSAFGFPISCVTLRRTIGSVMGFDNRRSL